MTPRNAVCFLLEPTETEGVMRRADTGEEMKLLDAPAGAMWEAPWMNSNHESPAYRINGSGPIVVVRMPNGGDWMPGSKCANCTMPDEPDHDCWCVHNYPTRTNVDKEPEPGRRTCNAGAGSIQHGNWHGFLRNGELLEL